MTKPNQKKLSLYDISVEFGQFQELLEQIDGTELESDQADQIDKFLEDLTLARDVKLDSYGGLIKELSARAEARKKEADRIAALSKSDKNKADLLKSRLMNFFTVNKLEEVNTLRFRFKRNKNSGIRPLEIVEEYIQQPKLLPAQFTIQETIINKEKIREVLSGDDAEAKKELEGIATLKELAFHLKIS